MVQSEQLWKTITPRQQAILVFVGANSLATPLTVAELTTKSQLGSPAVIHKAMQALCKAGLLSRKLSKADGRVKYLALTAKGLALFSGLDALLRLCAQA